MKTPEDYHEELLSDLKELDHLPEEKPSRLKKIILIGIAILFVLLMISFIFVTFPLDDIIKSKVKSSLLQDNVITLDNFRIVFENGTEEILKSYYFNEQQVEISLCLEGYQEGDYYITSLYEPQTYQAAFNQVSFESCSTETVIMLHTHPYQRCLASDTDLQTLEKNKVTNPDLLMVVMCEPDRFSIYT